MQQQDRKNRIENGRERERESGQIKGKERENDFVVNTGKNHMSDQTR